MKSLKVAIPSSVATDMKILHDIRDSVSACYPEARFIFFGSRARGNATCQSDLDLLILLDEVVTTTIEEHIGRLIYNIELNHGVVVNSIMLTKEQWDSPPYLCMPFRQSVEKEGIAL